MKNEMTVNKAELYQLKDLVVSVLAVITTMLENVGCPHSNSMEVTTMGGGNVKKFLCPDCGETIEEEMNYEFEL